MASASHELATPANWNHSEDCITVSTVSTDEAEELFPAGFSEVKPYLRTTKQPA